MISLDHQSAATSLGHSDLLVVTLDTSSDFSVIGIPSSSAIYFTLVVIFTFVQVIIVMRFICMINVKIWKNPISRSNWPTMVFGS